MTDDKYIEMVRLQAQIDVLTELPYMSVYKTDSQLNDLKMKSAVMMDDLIQVLNEKRDLLASLNGSKQISKLKKELKELNNAIDKVGEIHNLEIKKEIEEIIAEGDK